MKFQGAIIAEQGVTFSIVIVKQYVLSNSLEANKMINAFRPVFGNIPVVLMAQDSFGTSKYYGRKDIVNFLARVPMNAIPWKEYDVNL